MDPVAQTTAGIALITLLAVESGGAFLLRAGRAGSGYTDFQRSFFRAGHAHAGVLVILGLVSSILVGFTDLTGFWRWLGGTGALLAAILMPAGFFLGATGSGRTTPNRWFALLPAGATALGAGVLTLGLGLLTSAA